MNKKLIYILTSAAALQFVSACKRELNVNDQGRIPANNYYKSSGQAFTGLVAVYDRLGFQSGGLYDKMAIMDVAGGDQYAGGGGPSDINDLQVTENYTLTPLTGPASYLWNRGYSGVYRANYLLRSLPGIAMDDATKKRYTAEAKTLRAAFYFDLVFFFRSIPLLEGVLPIDSLYKPVQTTPDKIYAFVEKDLNEAIPDLPVTVPVATEGGRLTQGSAKALLGKVLLYEKKWQAAADQFKDVNGANPGATPSIYGYQLMPNFADLWKVKNKFNSESIIELVHTSKSNGDWPDAGASDGNLNCITSGPRSFALKTGYNSPDYYPGYGFLTFRADFRNFIHGDPRYAATVADIDSLVAAGVCSYSQDNSHTGYFLNKFAGRVSDQASSGTVPLNFPQDQYEIRLADTYLMEAEALMNAGADVSSAGRAYQLLNTVRARVGLGPVAVTQDNIETERRLELAGEGLRWPDLVRWGKAATVLAPRGFIAGRNEMFPIPQTELNNTQLQQNDGWK
ncbi:MAG: RagB/SusD family nutrient uptake outer membrane protein [Chitinophagaceae bacterium]|nr:RagB/SusD family nutrient uptake outer membrane protein [Chitinophagaceae bacterium]